MGTIDGTQASFDKVKTKMRLKALIEKKFGCHQSQVSGN